MARTHPPDDRPVASRQGRDSNPRLLAFNHRRNRPLHHRTGSPPDPRGHGGDLAILKSSLHNATVKAGHLRGIFGLGGRFRQRLATVDLASSRGACMPPSGLAWPPCLGAMDPRPVAAEDDLPRPAARRTNPCRAQSARRPATWMRRGTCEVRLSCRQDPVRRPEAPPPVTRSNRPSSPPAKTKRRQGTGEIGPWRSIQLSYMRLAPHGGTRTRDLPRDKRSNRSLRHCLQRRGRFGCAMPVALPG